MNIYTFPPRERLYADDIRDRLWEIFPQEGLSSEMRAAFAYHALQERPSGRDWRFAPTWPVVLRDIVGRVKPGTAAIETVHVALERWRLHALPGEASRACAKVALCRLRVTRRFTASATTGKAQMQASPQLKTPMRSSLRALP